MAISDELKQRVETAKQQYAENNPEAERTAKQLCVDLSNERRQSREWLMKIMPVARFRDPYSACWEFEEEMVYIAQQIPEVASYAEETFRELIKDVTKALT